MHCIATKMFRVELGRYKVAASFGSDVRVQRMQAKWKGGYGYISYSEEQLGQVSVGQYWWMDRSWGIHLSLFVLEFLSLVDDVFEDADGVEDDPPTGSSTTHFHPGTYHSHPWDGLVSLALRCSPMPQPRAQPRADRLARQGSDGLD
jgi:hypothetical protein